jgi:thermitase
MVGGERFMKKISKIKFYFVFIIFLFAFLIVPGIVFGGSDEEGLLLKTQSNGSISEIAQKYDISEDQIQEIPNIHVYKISTVSWDKKLKMYWDRYIAGSLKFVEPVHQYKATVIPNDTYYSEQWAQTKISAPQAWDITTGSESIKIAIVDTGIDGTHEDLNGKVTSGWDFVNGGEEGTAISENTDSDDNVPGHGTMVSGVTAAVTNNDKGVAGLNWQSYVMPVKVLDSDGYGNDYTIARGIIYAADNGAKVLNLSFGGATSSETLRAAIDYAYNLGCVIVAASGNDNSSIDEPARYSKVIAVGASTDSDERWVENESTGSNYGSELAVVAPGKYILTSIDYPGYNYGYATGTSLAAPYVSGLVSLILSQHSTFSQDQVLSQIENNTDKPAGMGGNNFTNEYGYGRINAYKAVGAGGTYQAQFISQSGYPTIMPGDTSEMQVQFKNVGTATWFSNSSNPVLLATDKLKDENFLKQFNDNWINDYRITSMSPSVVNPGETATFNFSVKAPNIGYGDYHFYVRLVSEGLTWFDNPDTNGGAWWNINIPKPSAEWQGQSGSVTASPGQEVSASVTFKNTTGSTWKKNGTGAIHLATDKLRDESFLDSFKASSWLGDYRISTFSEDEVENGQNATFNFNLKIPANIAPGTYRFYVRLVSEGYSWFENPDTNGGAWWKVNIPAPTASVVTQSAYPNVSPGETVNLSVTFKNTSQVAWNSSIIPTNLAIDKYADEAFLTRFKTDSWISNNRIASLPTSTVNPGENVTYDFSIKIPSDLTPGRYRFNVRLVQDGFSWFDNPDTNGGAWWEINVQ